MHVKTNPLAPAGSILQQTQCMYLLSMTFHVQDMYSSANSMYVSVVDDFSCPRYFCTRLVSHVLHSRFVLIKRDIAHQCLETYG